MNEGTLVALALLLLGWALLSERLARSNLTGPQVLLVGGVVLGNAGWGLVEVDVESATVHHLAEITLGLVLFADASTVRLDAVRHDLATVARLLAVGLPLSIGAGTVLAAVVFPDMPLALAGVVGASLAPTDAALSASVIADGRLPAAVRRVLNVESGLNDGIATPVVGFGIATSATVLGIATDGPSGGVGALGEIALGVLLGGALGGGGGSLLRGARRRGWADAEAQRLATLAVALLAFLVASTSGGNPFVAAFVGGLLFGHAARSGVEGATETTEVVGHLLALALWFVFGAGFLLPALERVDLRLVVHGVLSLTAVRMVPVALSLLGSGTDRATTAFIGWFGPRGLASVIFALLVVEELGAAGGRLTDALDAIALTVVLSVVAHGATARPLTARYLRRRGGVR